MSANFPDDMVNGHYLYGLLPLEFEDAECDDGVGGDFEQARAIINDEAAAEYLLEHEGGTSCFKHIEWKHDNGELSDILNVEKGLTSLASNIAFGGMKNPRDICAACNKLSQSLLNAILSGFGGIDDWAESWFDGHLAGVKDSPFDGCQWKL